MNQNYVKWLRNVHGLTQKALAEKAGYTLSHVQKVETGFSPVSRQYMERVHSTLGVDERRAVELKVMYHEIHRKGAVDA